MSARMKTDVTLSSKFLAVVLTSSSRTESRSQGGRVAVHLSGRTVRCRRLFFVLPFFGGIATVHFPMKLPLRSVAAVLVLGATSCPLGARTPEIPDWAWPGSATHQQVPPPADFHRPTQNFATPLGVFEGQSDIGGPLLPGGASYDDATQRYAIHSASYNIWYTRDEFRYLWKRMSGDVSLAADITFPNPDGYGDRKAVLVIRQDLDDDAKDELAGKICKALSVHAQIEEEIFYPAAREAVSSDDEDLLDEAEVEHGSITDLVTAVEEHEDDALFDAQIKVMSEWVKHHVKEEETELFPKLLKTDMDMKEIGAAMATRKEELMEEYDAETEAGDDDEDAGDGDAAEEEDEDDK